MWLKAQKLAPLTPMRQKHPVTHLRANVVMTRTVAVVTVIAIAIVANVVNAQSKLKAAIKPLQPSLATKHPLR